MFPAAEGAEDGKAAAAVVVVVVVVARGVRVVRGEASSVVCVRVCAFSFSPDVPEGTAAPAAVFVVVASHPSIAVDGGDLGMSSPPSLGVKEEEEGARRLIFPCTPTGER
jgi:hypothetical protein